MLCEDFKDDSGVMGSKAFKLGSQVQHLTQIEDSETAEKCLIYTCVFVCPRSMVFTPIETIV